MDSKQHTKPSVRAYWAIIRPVNLLITLLTQLIFVWAASRTNWIQFNPDNIRVTDTFITAPTGIWVLLACLFSAAAGYVINDLFDVDSDHINRPNKKILKRFISHKAATIYYVILMVLGITFGFIADFGMGLFCIAIAILLYFYSSDLKAMGLPGNLLVSFMAGAVVYLSSRSVWSVSNGHIAEFAILAFLVTLARELVKDIEDMKGDAETDCKTYPIVHGVEKTKGLIYGVMIFTMFGLLVYGILNIIQYGDSSWTNQVASAANQQTLTDYWSSMRNPWPMVVFSFAVLIPRMVIILIALHKAATPQDFRQISLKLKWLMILGLISVLFTPLAQ